MIKLVKQNSINLNTKSPQPSTPMKKQAVFKSSGLGIFDDKKFSAEKITSRFNNIRGSTEEEDDINFSQYKSRHSSVVKARLQKSSQKQTSSSPQTRQEMYNQPSRASRNLPAFQV